jgi:hypothetical protein
MIIVLCTLFIIFGKVIEIYEDHPPQGLSEARRDREVEGSY